MCYIQDTIIGQMCYIQDIIGQMCYYTGHYNRDKCVNIQDTIIGQMCYYTGHYNRANVLIYRTL